MRYKGARYLLGVDLGETCGLALYDKMHRKIVEVDSGSFWDLLIYTKDLLEKLEEDLEVYYEDPEKISTVYSRHTEDLYRKLRQGRLKMSDVKIVLKIAQNVGGVKILGRRYGEWLEEKGIPFRAIRPSSEKWDAKYTGQITGFTGRTNQHNRDAIKLVYGY